MADIFVFGSNLLGIHKKGAALEALKNHGAILGQGIGLQGTSYAIPTKVTPYARMELVQVNTFVAEFLSHAYHAPENTYHVTKIGCGLAGFLVCQIAPMFSLIKFMKNVKITQEFADNMPGIEVSPDLITTFSYFE